MPILLPPIPDLNDELLRLVCQIPKGRLATYGDVALALGDRRAAIWVSQTLADLPPGEDVPSHRVVRKQGDHGADPDRWEPHRILLAGEGIRILPGEPIPPNLRWNDFHTCRSLEALQIWQSEVAAAVSLTPLKSEPQRIGAVDLAYPEPGIATAAYVEIDPTTAKPLWSTWLRCPVTFPYITGYLTFRELPALRSLLDEVKAARGLPDLLFVDGNGILHPRRCGIATAVGHLVGLPTIGISKKQLSDRLESEAGRLVDVEGEWIAQRRIYKNPKHAYFISPGDHVTLLESIVWADRLQRDHHLPEPTYWADWSSHERPLPIEPIEH